MGVNPVSAVVAAVVLLLTACTAPARDSAPTGERPATSPSAVPTPSDDQPSSTPADSDEPRGTVTLAFAGDMHFELHLAALLERPRSALGAISPVLADADVTMANLESSITERGTPEAKELEIPSLRYHFRTSAGALDVLDKAGIDVVTMANNHGADYGPVGLADTLTAIRRGPIPVIGIGRDREAAFEPYRVSVRGTDLAFLAADASMREGSSNVWAAGPENAGVAAAHSARPRALLAAVRAASRRDDVVVVYLHWGKELQSCPTAQQQVAARALSEAGADIIVGTHAHVQLGSGWMGRSYVNYGLGNFLWYHNRQPDSGVLKVRVRDGEVVGDAWMPAEIRADGRPVPLSGSRRAEAVAAWRQLRGCTELAARPRVWTTPTDHPTPPRDR